MWKKEEKKDEGNGASRSRSEPKRDPAAGAREMPAETATIGRSIRIRGEVTGDENLVIQGHVDGSVDLRKHSVTVGPDGDVKASIAGKVITVEGHVEGDLEAGEQIVLRSSASVEGDLTAPRVVLEDGARFRGGVDMGEVKGGKTNEEPRSVSASPPKGSEPSRPKSSSSSSSSSGSAVESSSAKGNRSGDSGAEVTA